MNSNNKSEHIEGFSEEIDLDEKASIDDFIKELEAIEKDLHISAETVIEIEDSEFDDSFTEPSAEIEVPEPEVALETSPVAKPQSSEPEPAKSVLVRKLEKEIAELKNKISKMENERQDLFDLSRRRQTDFDNFKKRTERDKNETYSAQLGSVANGILPVLDNLNRAMVSVSKIPGEKSPDFKQFFEGIVLVNKQLNEAVADLGVSPIKALGEVFDPHFHEAVATEETADFESNIVIDELLTGYLLGTKVLRPSMVRVSKYSEAPSGPSTAESE